MRPFPEPKRAWVHFPDWESELAQEIRRVNPKNKAHHRLRRGSYWYVIWRNADGSPFIRFYGDPLPVTLEY